MRAAGIAMALLTSLAGCVATTVKRGSTNTAGEQPRIERQDVEFALDKGVSTVVVDNSYDFVNGLCGRTVGFTLTRNHWKPIP